MVAKRKTTKKKSKGTGLAIREVTSNVPAALQSRFADMMEEQQKKAPKVSSNDWITVTAQGFVFGDNDLGAEIDVVIVDHAYLNTFFGLDHEYDPDVITPPICFAVADDQDELEAHEKSPDAQSEGCEECWANKFNTAAKGKGKACKNYIRLAVVHVDSLEANGLPKVAYLRIPPSGITEYGDYINNLINVLKVPSMAVVTRLTVEGMTMGFTVTPKLLGIIEEVEIIDDKIMPLFDSVKTVLIAPPEYEAVEEAPKGKGKKKAVSKKKAVGKKKAVSKKKVGQRKAKY